MLKIPGNSTLNQFLVIRTCSLYLRNSYKSTTCCVSSIAKVNSYPFQNFWVRPCSGVGGGAGWGGGEGGCCFLVSKANFKKDNRDRVCERVCVFVSVCLSIASNSSETIYSLNRQYPSSWIVATRASHLRHMYGVWSVSACFPSELLVSRRKT